MTKVGRQAMYEQAAGYRAGLVGEPQPLKEKGRAYYNGWLNGKAEREQNEQEKRDAVV